MVIAGVTAASRLATIGLLPPSVKLKQLAHSTASTQVVVGGSSSLTFNYRDSFLSNMTPRAGALADMMASPQLRGYVARAAGVLPSEIGVDPPLWTDLQENQQWATGEKRGTQIVAEKDPYRITLDLDAYAPIIDVVTQAPTVEGAARLAHGVAQGLGNYVSDLATAAGTPLSARYDVTQLAPVSVDPGSKSSLVNVGVFTFLAVFVLWCGLLLVVSRLLGDLRAVRLSSKVHGARDRSSGSRAGWPDPPGESTSAG